MTGIAVLNGETWVICGGRNFANQAMFDEVMADIVGSWGCPEKVVHGGANGADAMAHAWAQRMAIEAVPMVADWHGQGKAAGPIRNQKMLDLHKPSVVIAFPGGRGTADMVAKAKSADGVALLEINETIQDRGH